MDQKNTSKKNPVSREQLLLYRANNRKHFKRLRLKEDIPAEERLMLEQKVRLNDGTIGEVVTFRKNMEGDLIYECHLCKCFAPNLKYKYFLEHFNGKHHKKKFSDNLVYSKYKFLVRYENKKLKENIDVGILPPCYIQTELDSCKEPLIGLEYLVEVLISYNKLSYYCLLCTKNCESNTVIGHLTSVAHYLQYFSMFCHKTTDHLTLLRSQLTKEQFKKELTACAAKLEQCGRLKPRKATFKEMETSVQVILDSIDRGPHLWEPQNLTTEDVKQTSATTSKIKEQSVISVPVKGYIETPTDLSSRCERDNYRGDFSNYQRSQNKPEASQQARGGIGCARSMESEFNSRQQGDVEYNSHSSSVDVSNQQVQDNPDTSVNKDWYDEDERRFQEYTQSSRTTQSLWQHYVEKVHQIETDLMEEMVYYHKNPVKHPKYKIERTKYYSERTEQLLRRGEDSMKYDIIGEFICLWDRLLQKMFDDIFRKEKAQLRQQLKLIFSSQHVEDIIPQTEDTTSQANKRNYKTVGHENKLTSPDTLNKRKKPNLDVIAVLRRLTVLEKLLGSLGPKIVDLLSKAILFEKSSSADLVLAKEENCLLLETIKEKLIGLVQFGVLQKSMMGVTEKAIGNINDLLAQVSEKESQFHSEDSSSFYDGGGSLFHRKSNPIGGQSFDRKSNPDEGSSFDRRSYPDGGRSFDRRSYPGGGRSFDRKTNPGDESSFDRRSYPDREQSFYKKSNPDRESSFDRKCYPDGGQSFDRKYNPDEGQPFDEKSYPDEEQSIDRMPYLDVGQSFHRRSYPGGGQSFDSKSNPDEGSSFDRRSYPDEGQSVDRMSYPDVGQSFNRKSNPIAKLSFDRGSYLDGGQSFGRKSNHDGESSFDRSISPDGGQSFDRKFNPNKGSSFDRSSYLDEGQSFNRKSNPDKRLSFDISSYPDGGQSFDKKSNPDERRSFGRKSYPDEGSTFGRRSNIDGELFNRRSNRERGPSFDKSSYSDERKTCSDQNIPYQDKRQSYDYKRTHSPQRRSSKDRSMNKNCRMIKVSEISFFIESLNDLSDLTFLEKTSMVQEIASNLIFRRQTEVSEDELLQLISKFTGRKQEPKNDGYFDKGERSVCYTQYTSADDGSLRKSFLTTSSLFQSPAHAVKNALFGNASLL